MGLGGAGSDLALKFGIELESDDEARGFARAGTDLRGHRDAADRGADGGVDGHRMFEMNARAGSGNIAQSPCILMFRGGGGPDQRDRLKRRAPRFEATIAHDFRMVGGESLELPTFWV